MATRAVSCGILQVWPDINPDSKLLLLDEPYSGLDVAQKVALDALLVEFVGQGAVLSSVAMTSTIRYSKLTKYGCWLKGKY